MLAHEDLPTLDLAEWGNAEDALRELEYLGLSSDVDTSESFLISPQGVAGDFHRQQARPTRRGQCGVKRRCRYSRNNCDDVVDVGDKVEQAL